MAYVWILVGLVVLVVGGELLVRYASRLAVGFGISPLVVGLTVVAFGTSSPELVTSLVGQLTGDGAIAIGTVVGSNIFNVLMILGISALVAPLAVDAKLLRFEVPAVIVASLAVAGFALGGAIAVWESAILVASLLAYTVWVIRQSRRESADVAEEYAEGVGPEEPGEVNWIASVLLVVVGLGLLVFGGRTFVGGAVELATQLGVSKTVIGLTVVAAGTSLPELVTSVIAIVRGQRDIAVGNVVGSNLFNLTGVLGITGLVGSGGLEVPPELLAFDIPVMIAAAVVCLPIMFTGGRIDRWEGAVLTLYFVGYVTYLVLNATGHVAAPQFADALVWFGLPLSVLTLAVIGYREWRGA